MVLTRSLWGLSCEGGPRPAAGSPPQRTGCWLTCRHTHREVSVWQAMCEQSIQQDPWCVSSLPEVAETCVCLDQVSKVWRCVISELILHQPATAQTHYTLLYDRYENVFLLGRFLTDWSDPKALFQLSLDSAYSRITKASLQRQSVTFGVFIPQHMNLTATVTSESICF